MLNENEIVDAVRKHLEARGMTDVISCTTKEQGYDIVAKYPDSDKLLVVEAKGATSARQGSPRFGSGFSRNQAYAHVAKAFYAAAAALQKKAGKADAAIALPKLPIHEALVEKIQNPLNTLGIEVIWVSMDGEVTSERRFGGQ